MWEKLVEFGRQILALKSQTQQNTSDIKELRRELQKLTAAVIQLAHAAERDRNNQTHEQEN